MHRPLAARTLADPDMGPRFAGEDFVLLDQSEAARHDIASGGLFLIHRPNDAVIRRIRWSEDMRSVVAGADCDKPPPLEHFTLTETGLLGIVQARVTFIVPDLDWP